MVFGPVKPGSLCHCLLPWQDLLMDVASHLSSLVLFASLIKRGNQLLRAWKMEETTVCVRT